MRAGLLADIILGESPHLKDLVRHFNVLVLNPSGKITGFNNHFINHSGKTEKQIMHQSFAKIFDSDEGKVELQMCVKQAMKGIPGSISFGVMESKVTFKGVILPVYDSGNTPSNLIIISKEEFSTKIEEYELDNFWNLATQMLGEAGIGTDVYENTNRAKKPRILLIEDKKGIVVRLFKNLVKSTDENLMLAPNSDAALLMASEFKPHVVISTGEPLGKSTISQVTDEFKSKYNSSTIMISTIGSEIRIEDGWLDIHVKNQTDSVVKILDLINQLYW